MSGSGGRVGETDQPRGGYRAPTRPQRVVSPPDGCGRSGLPARRQLLSVDRRLADGATADGPATQGRVAGVAGRHRSDVEPHPRRDLRGSSNALLLADLSERVGDRHQLPPARTAGEALATPAA